MPATNYAINKELTSEFKSGSSASYPAGSLPTANTGKWYIGLSLSTIDDEGNGVLEPKDRGYKRVGILRASSAWTNPTSGSLTNTSAIVFPQSTEHWGTIKEIFISTSPTVRTSGSYIWFHKEIDPPMAILDGTKITIPANAIAITRKE